jgi:hypothetical protein
MATAAERLNRNTDRDGAKPQKRVVNGNIPLGRIGGVEVRINWSWLVIFALIVWSLADGVFPSQNPGLSGGARDEDDLGHFLGTGSGLLRVQ